jgi:hypothetical protein
VAVWSAPGSLGTIVARSGQAASHPVGSDCDDERRES